MVLAALRGRRCQTLSGREAREGQEESREWVLPAGGNQSVSVVCRFESDLLHMIEEDGGIVVARIIIERKMMPDGTDRVDSLFSDGDDQDGETPAATELLGMLALTQDTVLHGGLYDDDGE